MTVDEINMSNELESFLLFDGVPSEKILSVIRCLGVIQLHYPKDVNILANADSLGKTLFLLSGIAVVVSYDINGNKSILETISKDMVIPSVLQTNEYLAKNISIISRTPCTVLGAEIRKAVEVRDCCLKYINIVRSNIIEATSQSNAKLLQQLLMLSNRSTREKVLSYLEIKALEDKNNTFDIDLSRQELADLLHVDRSSLSRELGKMQDEGLIICKGSTFTLPERTSHSF